MDYNKSENYTSFQNGITQIHSSRTSRKFPKIKIPGFKFSKKNLLKFGLPALGVLVFIFIISSSLSSKPSVQGATNSATDKPIATKVINREFEFPLRDEDGEEVADFKYVVESAELRRQIVVKGQRATAVAGRVFLIVNLKVINDLDQGVNINSRDYLRISVNGNAGELFAPDIHNDPVEAQAISTKSTRVGLAIDETASNIELQIGEIGGRKSQIQLDF